MYAHSALSEAVIILEAYRSGHNEAVLKTVWVKAHGGSNPSASAIKNEALNVLLFYAETRGTNQLL